MEITSKIEDQHKLIAIDGDVDASSAIILDKEISESLELNNINRVIIDCTSLEYISSAGLGVFISYLKDFENKNMTLVLFGMSEKVANVFEILGLNSLLSIVSTKENALEI